MNEKSGAELAAEKILKQFPSIQREYMPNLFLSESAAIITKHLPSGDVGKLREYLNARRKTIEASIASEMLAGNEWKEKCERTALAEITALERHLASVPANPPQVDTELEEIAHELRKQITLPIRSVVDNSLLESIASTLLAHARKSQPKEGVNERLLKAAKQMRRFIGVSELQEPSHKGACGPESCCDAICQDNAWSSERNAALEALSKAIEAAESAVVPSMESENKLAAIEKTLGFCVGNSDAEAVQLLVKQALTLIK